MQESVDIYAERAYSMHCQGGTPPLQTLSIHHTVDPIEPFQKIERKNEDEKVCIPAPGPADDREPGSLRQESR